MTNVGCQSSSTLEDQTCRLDMSKRGCSLSRPRSGYIDGDVLSVSSDLDQDAARAQTSFDLQLCPVGERNTGGRHIGRVGATEYHRSRLQGIHYASSHTKRTDPGLIGFNIQKENQGISCLLLCVDGQKYTYNGKNKQHRQQQ